MPCQFRRALACALVVLVGGCQPLLVQDGIGGTGQRVADGLGGTGQKFEDGIGGTGIVGTVTDFGSIWVNGVRVEFDENTPVFVDGEPRNSTAIELGHVIASLTEPTRRGYRAHRIDVVHEVIGPITSYDKREQRLTVLNQTVVINERTRIAPMGALNGAAPLEAGQWASVSGLRRSDGQIVARRVDRVGVGRTVQLIGTLDGSSLAGMPVVIPPTVAADASLDRLRVRGRLVDGVIHVTSAEKGAVREVVDQATDLLLEGYLFDSAFDGGIAVGGIDIVLPDGIDLDGMFTLEDAVYLEAELGDDDLFYSDELLLWDEGEFDVFDDLSDIDEMTDDEFDLWLE